MTKPAHYDVPIDVLSIARFILTEEEYRGAMKFNALKYFFRQGRKEGTNDPKKCYDYLMELQLLDDGFLDKADLLDCIEADINNHKE